MKDISQYIHLCAFEGLQKKANKWNFRCQICGDSGKSKQKKRAWILWDSTHNQWVYYCFNCGASISFFNFLKEYHKDAYDEFRKEKLSGKYKKEKIVEEIKEVVPVTIKMDVTRCSELNDNHPAIEYLKERKIPKVFYKYLRYSDNFSKWINTKIPEKFSKPPEEDKRIIIPFYTTDKKLFGVAGRSLNKEDNLRYITIKFFDHPKIFGLERLDNSKDVFVFEGQIDSLFIPNSVAMSGGDIKIDSISNYIAKDKIVFIWDNEINHQVFKKIEGAINQGFRVCLLPKEMRKFGKDINDYIISGFTRKELYTIIQDNTFFGLRAKAVFSVWKGR